MAMPPAQGMPTTIAKKISSEVSMSVSLLRWPWD
jgi:hypothetical protein